MGKKVLIIGSGAREHALGWNIAKSPEVSEVIYTTGNAGTAEGIARNIAIDCTKKENFPELLKFIEKEGIDLVIIGPEKPLDLGIVDYLYEHGYKNAFGPRKAAVALESDKFFSFDIMQKLSIPQANSVKCYTIDDAVRAIKARTNQNGIVIKARGLTEGKGVSVCNSLEDALKEITHHAGKYGQEVLIAERLIGQEFSVFGISDGERVIPIEISFQDHKPLLDFDKGPNTGGMGAYGPAPIASAELVKFVANNMMTPVIQQMKKDGREYKGFVYAGMIMTEDGPKVIEFNVRFGDPECQPAMMMMKNGLYVPLSLALESRLDEVNIEFNPGAACCVVMASNGYPRGYDQGLPIGGLEEVAGIPGVKVFHAGTAIKDELVVTAGGRILGVTGYSSLKDPILAIIKAQDKAYQAVEIIDLATRELNNKITLIYRSDVADKAINY